MNTSNTPAILRSLIIYGLCVPLAIWLGFMLADPFDRATFSYFGIMALLMVTPILLRWHHFLLIALWNLTLTIFFLPGTPALWLPMVAVSLGISVLHRAVSGKARSFGAAQIQWPLYFSSGRGLSHGGTDRGIWDEVIWERGGGRPTLHFHYCGHSRLFRADGSAFRPSAPDYMSAYFSVPHAPASSAIYMGNCLRH